MYLPPHFSEPDRAALHALVAAHPLGALVTQGPEGLDANHIPFLITPGKDGAPDRLEAHLARANPALAAIGAGAEVLVIFRAEQAYVSPSWYPSKHEAHRQVPTWNYRVVHAHGRAVLRDDERFLRPLLARLTRVHEAPLEKPWKMADAERSYLDARMKDIVGLEIVVTRLEGKSKLSQNKERRDIEGAARGLAEHGAPALGAAMLAAAPEG
ncbi:FMN-binding negative transcriptional regulator [Roseomonas sp. USHLN139]|uniref:FMN-binding negative transcriptional regulator n=1 Tax=Roseomonas sp. USHLN139 TaxID=3081298 RepID=UPI003B026C98